MRQGYLTGAQGDAGTHDESPHVNILHRSP